ncbi:MAG: RagB/SusD family nutrient uptake outer membrane protein [Bacteroidota bacterium]
MKKYFIYTCMLLCLMGTTACNDFLNLEPETSLSGALAFDNLEGIEAGINGAYNHLHSDWVERQWIFAECFTNSVYEINPVDNTNYQDVLRHERFTDMQEVGNFLWELSFKAINLSNQIILAIPDVEVRDQVAEASRNRLWGESLFLRGMSYFVLNRFYAQPQNGLSVPLLTEPAFPGDQPARASIEAVESQVIADLEQAAERMKDVANNQGRATIYAVYGMLARASFEYGDDAAAENWASRVIDGPFSLNDGNVSAAYGLTQTSENVFSFLASTQDRAATRLFTRFSGIRSVVMFGIEDDLWDIIQTDTSDLRTKELYNLSPYGEVTTKYDDRNMLIPYLRLPEMYLIRAEARANQNRLDEALADLNRLRQRAGLIATTYSSQQDLLDQILRDRTIEMGLEGDRFHNLKRLQRSIGGLPWSEASYKLVFYLPEKEVRLNPNMIQNEPW